MAAYALRVDKRKLWPREPEYQGMSTPVLALYTKALVETLILSSTVFMGPPGHRAQWDWGDG